jgi:hypothetical protein
VAALDTRLLAAPGLVTHTALSQPEAYLRGLQPG